MLLLSFALLATARADEPGCEAKCSTSGHCCVGANSACQRPSCAMGCLAGADAPSEAACNATCVSAGGKTPGSSGCSYRLNTNVTFEMCGTCPVEPAPSWWPASIRPPAGEPPSWWPPGYSLPHCSSCSALDGDPVGECKLGCLFAFRPSLKPTPPAKPQPPPPHPPSPACGVFDCTAGGDLNFSSVFSTHAVLQAAPARAAVYGFVGLNASAAGYGSAKVTITIAGDGTSMSSYSVAAVVNATSGVWKAFLAPQPPGGSYTISARCDAGCTGIASVSDVVFGDVWYW
eukprot:5063771-Prymnesium_polylepis.1